MSKRMRGIVATLVLVAAAGCGSSEEPAVTSGELTGADASPAPVASTLVSPGPSASAAPTGGEPPSSEPAPPAATMTGDAGAVELEQGSSCWTSESGAGLCVDTIGPGEQTPAFATSSGETVTLSFDTADAPNSVQAMIWPVGEGGERTETRPATTNPTSYEVTVEPGDYFLVLFTLWDEGDASYHVRLEVR